LHWRYVGGQINELQLRYYHLLFRLDIINLTAVLIFNFCNFIRLQLSADNYKTPAQQQAVNVRDDTNPTNPIIPPYPGSDNYSNKKDPPDLKPGGSV
jgi:hypothetical protein